MSTDLSPPWWRAEDYNPTLGVLAEQQELGLASLIGLAAEPRAALRSESFQRSRTSRVLAIGLLTGAILGFVLALHMAQAPDGGEVIRLGWYGTAVLTSMSVQADPVLACSTSSDRRTRARNARPLQGRRDHHLPE